MAELGDVMLAMAEHDQIEIAFRRLGARQLLEARFAEHLGDRAQPVGAFGMARGRQMVETGGMGQNKCHAGSWRKAMRGAIAANLGAQRRARKGPGKRSGESGRP